MSVVSDLTVIVIKIENGLFFSHIHPVKNQLVYQFSKQLFNLLIVALASGLLCSHFS